MTIQVQKEDNLCTINLAVRLDTTTAPELEKAVLDNIAGVETLVFDLQDLSYTSSAGLRVFLKAQKQMNRQGNMKLKNVCPDIMEIFEVTGFTDILTIE